MTVRLQKGFLHWQFSQLKKDQCCATLKRRFLKTFGAKILVEVAGKSPWTCMFPSKLYKIFYDAGKTLQAYILSHAGKFYKILSRKMETIQELCLKRTNFDSSGWNLIFTRFCMNHGKFSMHASQNTCNQIFLSLIVYSSHGFFHFDPWKGWNREYVCNQVNIKI